MAQSILEAEETETEKEGDTKIERYRHLDFGKEVLNKYINLSHEYRIVDIILDEIIKKRVERKKRWETRFYSK